MKSLTCKIAKSIAIRCTFWYNKLYATVENNENTYILSNDVEKDARQAEMTVEKYIEETKRINPQFSKVFTL